MSNSQVRKTIYCQLGDSFEIEIELTSDMLS